MDLRGSNSNFRINPSSSDTNNQSKKRRLQFVDYNLSELKDTKGGFIVNKDTEQALILPHRKKYPASSIVYEHLLDENQQECSECKKASVNRQFLSVYKFAVCQDCIDLYREKYSLLTKTDCRTDYLLTDEELESLPYMERQNPHKSSYSRMKLYLRCQIEEFAVKKWGSLDEMDLEFERRQQQKQKSKEIKFKKNLLDLRKRTMTSRSVKLVSTQLEHTHSFIDATDGSSTQVCSECGFSVEVEEF